MTWELGQLSEQYESGDNGPGTVSSGRADPGGVSYGTYQLATKSGTVAEFMAAEGKPWTACFGGAAPGTLAFNAAWQLVAKQYPEAFGAAQHAFIERTHYRPCVAAVKAATGLDLDSRCNAIRDATWSCSVQHGRAAKIIEDAVAIADKQQGRSMPLYDRVLLAAIYRTRSDYLKAIANRSDPATRNTLLSIVANRYPDEFRRAQEMLA